MERVDFNWCSIPHEYFFAFVAWPQLQVSGSPDFCVILPMEVEALHVTIYSTQGTQIIKIPSNDIGYTEVQTNLKLNFCRKRTVLCNNFYLLLIFSTVTAQGPCTILDLPWWCGRQNVHICLLFTPWFCWLFWKRIIEGSNKYLPFIFEILFLIITNSIHHSDVMLIWPCIGNPSTLKNWGHIMIIPPLLPFALVHIIHFTVHSSSPRLVAQTLLITFLSHNFLLFDMRGIVISWRDFHLQRATKQFSMWRGPHFQNVDSFCFISCTCYWKNAEYDSVHLHT